MKKFILKIYIFKQFIRDSDNPKISYIFHTVTCNIISTCSSLRERGLIIARETFRALLFACNHYKYILLYMILGMKTWLSVLNYYVKLFLMFSTPTCVISNGGGINNFVQIKNVLLYQSNFTFIFQAHDDFSEVRER